jgi:hypothetical protein
VDVKLPQLDDIQGAVQRGSFVDPVLRQARAQIGPDSKAAVASGGFALTFDVSAGGRRFAVRCFRRQGAQLRERYIAVADFVRQYRGKLEFLTDVAYVAEGIRVKGDVYPIVRMTWVDGQQLDDWVQNHLHEPHRLDRVRDQVATVAGRLRAAGAAHGDLQHGNILVDSSDRIRLVDYDGMFLPALAGLGASEYGHRNFQHPDRADSYNKQLDVFAASVIDLSLDAVKHDPSLWKAYNTGENLILEAEDFAAPAESEVFARLTKIAPLAERTRRLMDACQANFAAVPAILAGDGPSPHSLRSPGSFRRSTGPRALDAHDRAALIARVGDHITIVGQVTDTGIRTGPNTTTSFINFGDWREGAVRIVAWGKISRELEAAYGKNAEELRGSWVTISGLVRQFHSKGSNAPSPQIELKRLQTLRLVTETDAKARLVPPPEPEDPPAPPPKPEPAGQPEVRTADGVYRLKATPKSKPKPAASVDKLARDLHRLYSSPGFSRRAPAAAAPPSQPAPAPQPAPPPPTYPPPAPPQPRYPVSAPPPPYWPVQPTPSQPRANRAKPGFWQRLRDRLRW